MMFENAEVKMEGAGYVETQKDVIGGSRFSFVFQIDFKFSQEG